METNRYKARCRKAEEVAANARTDAEALKKASEVKIDKLTRDLAKATEGWQGAYSFNGFTFFFLNSILAWR